MNVVRFPIASIRGHARAAELLAAGRVVPHANGGQVLEIDYEEHRHLFTHPVAAASLEVPQPEGPGTELKLLLSRIGITAKPGCSCNARASEMDSQGCEWCEQNIDTIVGWLREEATKRGLPFIDAAGRLLVRRAIGNARRRHGKSQG